mgnify:CR=1 FL=1
MDILKKIFEAVLASLVKEHWHKIKRKIVLSIIGFITFVFIIFIIYNGFWIYKTNRIYNEILRKQVIAQKVIMILQGCNTNGIYIGILRMKIPLSFELLKCTISYKECTYFERESLYEELRGILYTDRSLQPIETKFMNDFYSATHIFDKKTMEFVYNEYKKNGLAVITEEIANIYSLEYFKSLYESLPVHKENKKVAKIFILPHYNKKFGLDWAVAMSFADENSKSWCNETQEKVLQDLALTVKNITI